jgi:hypothetical protein
MQSVAKSQLKHRFSNSQFRLGVLGPDERHTFAQILIGMTT